LDESEDEICASADTLDINNTDGLEQSIVLPAGANRFTDAEDEDDALIPPSKKRKGSSKEKNIKWKKSKQWNSPIDESFSETGINLNKDWPGSGDLHSYSSPITFLWLYFDENFLDSIVYQTNLYNTWRSIKKGVKLVSSITKEEILKTLGIITYMGIVKLPDRRMYWAAGTRIDAIAETMSRNRFEEILHTLHFNDNTQQKEIGEEGFNRLFKLAPVLDHFRKAFKGAVLPETSQAIDEMIIPFKGKHGLKMYMPKKPIKWGYKLWCRAGISGYVYDFEVAGGGIKGAPDGVDAANFGESELVVLRLVDHLQPNKHKIFFDNYFSSPELLIILKEMQIFAVATLRENRARKCPIATESELKKKGRGAMDFATNAKEEIIVCGWYDSKRILIASNYLGKDPIGHCNRFDRKERKKISVERPAIVAEYNKQMGGVDKSDMLLALYRTKCRTRKGYMRIFYHLCNLAVVNSWCLYKQIGGKSCLKDFIVDISRSLMGGSTPHVNNLLQDDIPPPVVPARSLSAHQVPFGIRYDKHNHWPIQIDENAMRCKLPQCKRKSRFMCTKCNLCLCVIGSSGCFIKFHVANY